MADVEQDNITKSSKKFAIKDGVRVFKLCGPSAQLLLLENGFWRKLNSWIQTAISSKDIPSLKEILNLLLMMPTSFSQLMENTGGIPLTVEGLLKRTALKRSEFDVETEKDLKMLCAKLFARWLLIKKRMEEVTDPEKISVETETGEMGALAPIAYRPGYGFLALNGRVSVVEMKVYHQTPTKPSNPSVTSLETIQSSGMLEHQDVSQENSAKTCCHGYPGQPLENDVPFQESVCRSDKEPDVLEDLDTASNCDRPRSTGKVFITSKSRTANLLDEMLSRQCEDLSEHLDKSQPATLTAIVEKIGTTSGPTISSCVSSKEETLRSMFDEDYDLSLEEIEKKIEDDLDDPDRLVIDENIGKFIPWKVHKIHFTKKLVDLEVKSEEVGIQKLREYMVAKGPLEKVVSYPQECPQEVDDEHDGDGKVLEEKVKIPTEDIKDDTKLYDYSGQKWPEPELGMALFSYK